MDYTAKKKFKLNQLYQNNITISMQIVGFLNVLICAGNGQDNDRVTFNFDPEATFISAGTSRPLLQCSSGRVVSNLG